MNHVTNGVVRGSHVLLLEYISCWSMKEFIDSFSTFLDIQTTLIAEFYEVIHAIEEAKKMGLTSL